MSSEPDRLARDRWSAAHGGVDPDASVWVRGWLSLVHRLARPLAARHVAPGLVTVAGLLVSAGAPGLAAAPGAWPVVAGALAVAAGVLDGVDGAVARLDDTETSWGAVLDALADRVSDLLLLGALWVLGAPAWICLAAATLTLLQESVRSSARAAGLVGIGVITVWERPSRIIVVTVVALVCGLARPAGLSDGTVEALATAGAVVGSALAAWSIVHLTLTARRQLRAVRPDRPAR